MNASFPPPFQRSILRHAAGDGSPDPKVDCDVSIQRSRAVSHCLPIMGVIAILATPIYATAAVRTDETIPAIGQINFFGYGGINLRAVEMTFPINVGGVIQLDNLESTQNLIVQRIKLVIGHEPSNLEFVCCDENQHLLVYIGLGGSTSHTPAFLRCASRS